MPPTRNVPNGLPEEIVAQLRQGDVLISQDQSVADAIGVSAVTYE